MMELTKEIAFTAGQDEGNRNMKKNGREQWNEDDYNAASKKTNEILDLMEARR